MVAARENMKLWITIASFTYFQCTMAHGVTQNLSLVQFVKIGEMASITCSISDERNHAWYKEREDGGLMIVDNSLNSYRKDLIIEDVKKSDSGVYYCSQTGLDKSFYVASMLVVTERDPEDPTLSLFIPVEERNQNSGTSLLLCVANNWSRKWSEIRWSSSVSAPESLTTVSSDGSLTSLMVAPAGTKVKCYITMISSDEDYSADVVIMSELAYSNGDSTSCYTVMYVAIASGIILLLVHQIILAYRRRTLVRDTSRPGAGPVNHPDTRCEPAVRFRPETETVRNGKCLGGTFIKLRKKKIGDVARSNQSDSRSHFNITY